jgi:hypothetical protein
MLYRQNERSWSVFFWDWVEPSINWSNFETASVKAFRTEVTATSQTRQGRLYQDRSPALPVI